MCGITPYVSLMRICAVRPGLICGLGFANSTVTFPFSALIPSL